MLIVTRPKLGCICQGICRYESAMGPTKLVQLSGYTKNIQHEQACPKSPMTHFHDPDACFIK